MKIVLILVFLAIISSCTKITVEVEDDDGKIPSRYPNFINGSSNAWIDDSAESGIYIDIDISSHNLTKTPFIFTSITGDNSLWEITGVTNIYGPNNHHFRVYIRYSSGVPLTLAIASSYHYTLNYLLIPQE